MGDGSTLALLQAARAPSAEAVPVRLDHLFLWLSAKGNGSWSQFRSAVEALLADQINESRDSGEEKTGSGANHAVLPVHQRISLELQRLGHCEFSWNEQGQGSWRVVPPTIALLPNRRDTGILCGARSPDLLERLDDLEDIKVKRTERIWMPLRITVQGDPAAISHAATQAGCLVQDDAANAILAAVPTVRAQAAWRRTEIPETSGWTVHRFSSTKLRWVDASASVATTTRDGFFRFVMKHQRFYYLRWDGRSYKVPVQVGKYAVRRRKRGVLAHDSVSGAFSVPRIFRPPLLIERALVLCSGFLPEFDSTSRRATYAGVPSDVARLVAQLLRQEVG